MTKNISILILWVTSILITCLNACKVEPDDITKSEGINYCLNQRIKEKIQTVQATRQPVTESIPLTGVIEANPDRVIHFVSLLDGIITKTYFSLGDEVEKGQVLAELRSIRLSELQAQHKVVEAQIHVAGKKLQATQSMYNDGIASLKELAEAKSELDVLQAEREKIVTNLGLFSASENKGVFLIKAPASGTIIAKSIAPGAQITAEGAALFTVADLSEIWVSVNVYATNVKNITVGMPVNIKTLSYPNEVFQGKISSISQVLDPEAKVVKARVVMKNEGQKLKPGMIVDVSAIKYLEQEAVAIPTAALIFDDNQNFVVVYKDDCNLEIRQVELLSKSNGTSFISAGLVEHETVLTKNQLLVYDQLKNFQ